MDAAAERAVKHTRIEQFLDAASLDGVLLSRRCNFSWYTGGARNYVATACDAGNSFLLVRPDRALVVANTIEAPRLAQEDLPSVGAADIEVVSFPYQEPGAQNDTLRRLIGSGRFAADAGGEAIGLAKLGADFDHLRWTLTDAEIRRYRHVCADTVEALESVARSAPRGAFEHELAAELSAALRRKGLLPWVLLVSADARMELFRHPLPTDQRADRAFMLVAGAERRGLVAAHSRLASFGPVSNELARRQRACATVDAALLRATVPGAALGEVFAEAQKAYAAVGFPDQWRMHHQGGSCGYLPREVRAAPGDKTVVLADQAFAWNPSITGAKSEDTVLCRAGGVEMLHRPTDWPVIRAEWNGREFDRPDILVRD